MDNGSTCNPEPFNITGYDHLIIPDPREDLASRPANLGPYLFWILPGFGSSRRFWDRVVVLVSPESAGRF